MTIVGERQPVPDGRHTFVAFPQEGPQDRVIMYADGMTHGEVARLHGRTLTFEDLVCDAGALEVAQGKGKVLDISGGATYLHPTTGKSMKEGDFHSEVVLQMHEETAEVLRDLTGQDWTAGI